MARLNIKTPSDSDDELYIDHGALAMQQQSSPLGASSDKENASTQTPEPNIPTSLRGKGKGKARNSATTTAIPTSRTGITPLGSRSTSVSSGRATSRIRTAALAGIGGVGEDVDMLVEEAEEEMAAMEAEEEKEERREDEDMGMTMQYDPNQDPEERREIRKAYKDLHRRVNDNKSEYLKKDSNALIEIFREANSTFKKVKQTTDACLDAKLLLTMGELAVKRAQALSSNSSNLGLDVEDFINKTIKYLSSTPDAERENRHDWAHLGKTVSSRTWRRPATKDFLLGPLGIIKKQRMVKERKRVQRRRLDELVRPDKLDEKEIAKNENSTTKHVQDIASTLDNYVRDNDLDAQGVVYLKLVINPHSFSQTIENIFYTSFLIRDAKLAMAEDEDGLIYLVPSETPTTEEILENEIVKKQIIMPMDMKTWREAIEVFQIKEPIIPHRQREKEAINASGWYS